MIYLCQLLALLTTHNQSPLFIRKSNDKYVININLSLTSGYYNNQCWLAMSTHVIQRDIPTMMSEGRPAGWIAGLEVAVSLFFLPATH